MGAPSVVALPRAPPLHSLHPASSPCPSPQPPFRAIVWPPFLVARFLCVALSIRIHASHPLELGACEIVRCIDTLFWVYCGLTQ